MVDLLAKFGLIDLVLHFHHCYRFRNLKTSSQVQQGTVLQSRCDYIIGPDRCRFELVGIRNMQNFLSDHFALRARLLRFPTRCHYWYHRGRRASPLMIPPAKERSRADNKFQNLKSLEPVLTKLKPPPRPLWMSPASIRLIEKRTALRWNPRRQGGSREPSAGPW